MKVLEGQPPLTAVVKDHVRPGEQILLVENRREQMSVRVKQGRLEAVERGHEAFQAVRLITEGRFGYQGSRAADWAELLADARRHAAQGPSADWTLSDLGPAYEPNPAEVPDPSPEALCVRARALSASVQSMRDGLVPQVQIRWTRHVTRMADEQGRERRWVQTEGQIAVNGRVVKGQDFWSVGDHAGKAGGLPDADALLAHVRERLDWGRHIVDLPPGAYPVLVLPPVGLSLLTAIVARLSAPAVVTRTSPWVDRVGARVLHPSVSLYSDPTVEDGPRSVPWDDEGTPTRRVPLVEEGAVREWILDRQGAHQLGSLPPGTAFSGELGSLPTARPSNLTVGKGQQEDASLLASHPRLLILEGWIGGRPVNPLRGEIAGTATGLYLVEHGAVVGRIKDAVVSVNAFDAWGDRLLALSRARRWVGGGMMQLAPALLPSLLVDEVGVARKT